MSVLRRICVSRQKRAQAGRQAGSLARRIAFIFPEWLRWHSESKRKWLFKRRRKTQTASLFCNNQPSFHYDSRRAGGGKKGKKKRNYFSGGLGSCLGSKSESERGFPVAGARLPIKDESVLSLPAAASRQRSNHSPPPPPPPQRP